MYTGEYFDASVPGPSYAMPFRTEMSEESVIRTNGDVGSNVALAPSEDGKVSLRLENRNGELRV